MKPPPTRHRPLAPTTFPDVSETHAEGMPFSGLRHSRAPARGHRGCTSGRPCADRIALLMVSLRFPRPPVPHKDAGNQISTDLQAPPGTAGAVFRENPFVAARPEMPNFGPRPAERGRGSLQNFPHPVSRGRTRLPWPFRHLFSWDLKKINPSVQGMVSTDRRARTALTRTTPRRNTCGKHAISCPWRTRMVPARPRAPSSDARGRTDRPRH